jgi:hypothetical protein
MIRILHEYFSALRSRRIRWPEHVPHLKEMKSIYNVLVDRPEGKHSYRWEDNIKIHLERSKMRGCGLDSCGSE